jgi:hypothetical protein
MRNYGNCPACGARFGPGHLPRVFPTTCPDCGELLRISPAAAWTGALLAAAGSALLSAALGFHGVRLWAVALALWFPLDAVLMIGRGLLWPPTYRRASGPDRFDSPLSLFRKPRP